MLVAEDLLLLAYHDTRGVDERTTSLDHAVAAAVLAELTSHGTITVSPDPIPVIRVQSTKRLGDEVLDRLIENADAYRGVRVDKMAWDDGPSLLSSLLDRLVARGALRKQRGLLPKVRWPSKDPSHEIQIRDRLGDVLVRGITPDVRTATLIGLLLAFNRVDTAVERRDVAAAEERAAAIPVPEAIGRIIYAAARAGFTAAPERDATMWDLL